MVRGSRGLASILFAIVVVDASQITAGHDIFQIAILTVLFIVFLHGMTAWPGSKWYAAHVECDDRGMIEEKQVVDALPVRGQTLFH